MLNPHRLKALEGLLDYLSGLQGGDLKALVDESKKPMEGSPLEEKMESPEMELLEDGKPKGMSVEKVSIMGKDPEEMEKDGPEMSKEMCPDDDEMDELYKQFRKK